MNAYRDTLKKRLKLLIALNALAIFCICVTLWLSQLINHGEQMLDGMMTGYQIGIFLGLQMIMVIMMIRYRKAIQNDQLLKKMQIYETDERNKWIQGEIGAISFKLIVSGTLLGSVIAGFFNQTIFLTLFCMTIFIVMVQLGLKLYYQNKY